MYIIQWQNCNDLFVNTTVYYAHLTGSLLNMVGNL